MVFHLEGTDAAGSSLVLSIDKLAQGGQGHCFLLVVDIEEVARLHLYDGIYLGTRLDNFAQALELADVVLLQCPVVLIIRQRIILNRCCRQSRHYFFTLKFIQTKTKATFRLVVKVGNICHHSWRYLQLYVFNNRGTFLFNIGVLEIYFCHVSFGDNIGTEHKSTDGYKCGGKHVRTQQTAKTHARSFHRNNL